MNDWRWVEEIMILVAKQQCIRFKEVAIQIEAAPIMAPRVPREDYG